MLLQDVFNDKNIPIEKVFLPKGENLSFEPFECELWIIKKGTLALFRDKEKKRVIELGQVFFLPPGSSCILISEQQAECFRFFTPDCVALCEKFLFPGLIEEKINFNSSFNPIEINPTLWEYTRHLHVLFSECRLSPEFLRMKLIELFHLLNFSYSKRELAGLFFPVLKREDTFARFIEENYPRFRTAGELAREAHMSLKSFENRFKQVFGTSPGRWILQKKIQIVYQEIISSPLSLTSIADKCGFATLSHMTDFCKKHMGASPSQIRKGRIL